MVCFWIGCNHVSHGLTKIKPGARLTLELVSLVLLLITWCFTIPGIALYTNTGLQAVFMDGTADFGQVMNLLGNMMNFMGGIMGEEKPLNTKDWEKDSEGTVLEHGVRLEKALGHDVFVAFCSLYTIYGAFFLILNLIFRKEYLKLGQKPLPRSSEWADRPKRDNCCGICTPCNGLRMFHNSYHFWGLFGFIICAILQVELYFTIPLILLTFAQVIISYLYAEDIVLCTLPLCCVSLYFIRRYPKEEFGGMDHKMEGVLSV